MLFITSGTLTDLATTLVEEFPHRHLDKPFEPHELGAALETISPDLDLPKEVPDKATAAGTY